MMQTICYLHMLAEGQMARIRKIPADCALYTRLADLGVTDGCRIRCLRHIRGIGAYDVRGTVLALRDAQTRRISVLAEGGGAE